jgi:hypothetical protein
MNTQDNQDYWQQQITAWQVSDLSGAAFCREHGLTCHRFYYWRQKLLPTPRVQTDSSSGFAKVVPAQYPGTPGELIVSLPGGIAISGLHPGNIDLLGAILRQL